MRSALPLLAVLVLAGCTTEQPVGSGLPTPPSGPCAKTREQPPDGSREQRLQGDLDGDGRTAEVVSWVRDGQRVVQAWLATGQNADPQALFSGDLLQARDVDGDGRVEVLAAAQPGGPQVVLRLEGCSLALAAGASASAS